MYIEYILPNNETSAMYDSTKNCLDTASYIDDFPFYLISAYAFILKVKSTSNGAEERERER